MRMYFAIVLLVALMAGQVLAQNKVLSTTPTAGSLPIKQLEVNIGFLTREMDRLERLIKKMAPKIDDMASCQGASMIYAPGAVGVGVDTDGADAGTDPDGCVDPTSGGDPIPTLVTAMQATTSTTRGFMSGGTSATSRMQNFINGNGCPTASGWHPCSDDEVVFALDQEVVTPATIIDGSTYWVRSLFPHRFDLTDAQASATLNCNGWNSVTSSAVPYTIAGTMFDGSSVMPVFNFGDCSVWRKVLCCK